MRTVGLAKRLRRELSLPEVLLWQALRQRPAGLKFRRQHPAGDFVLDFYCAGALLAVEIDGETHNDPTRADHDRRRDAWLAARRVKVLRIPATLILKDVSDAVEMMIGTVLADQPLHHAAARRGPPPHAGEDL